MSDKNELATIAGLDPKSVENLVQGDGWVDPMPDTADLIAQLDDDHDDDMARFILIGRARYAAQMRDQMRALVAIPRP